MKKNPWLIVFIVALLTELIAVQLNDLRLQYIAKPLMIPALAAYFFTATKDIASTLKKWILLALFFSWTGDVILLFQEKRSIFFLLGLSSFLLAHIFYILLFHHIRIKENIKGKVWPLLIVAVYYFALISWLSPYLAEMKLPVRVYGVVISFMFMVAMHLLFIKNRVAGKWIVAGALLFCYLRFCAGNK
jgi:uncharacterized membrane protein YhhN